MIVLIDSIAMILLVVGWWIAIGSYPRLPASIPIHFGLKGEADGWGGRWMIFLQPLIATLVCGINWYFFSRVRGAHFLPVAMARPMHLLLLEMAAIFTFITWRMIEVALGRGRGLGVWFIPFMLLAMSGTGVWMIMVGKVLGAV